MERGRNSRSAGGGINDGRRNQSPVAGAVVRRAFALVPQGRAQMKTPEPSKENPSAPNSAKFTGTDNPRHLRAITALLRRPLPRENLDTVAGLARVRRACGGSRP